MDQKKLFLILTALQATPYALADGLTFLRSDVDPVAGLAVERPGKLMQFGVPSAAGLVVFLLLGRNIRSYQPSTFSSDDSALSNTSRPFLKKFLISTGTFLTSALLIRLSCSVDHNKLVNDKLKGLATALRGEDALLTAINATDKELETSEKGWKKAENILRTLQGLKPAQEEGKAPLSDAAFFAELAKKLGPVLTAYGKLVLTTDTALKASPEVVYTNFDTHQRNTTASVFKRDGQVLEALEGILNDPLSTYKEVSKHLREELNTTYEQLANSGKTTTLASEQAQYVKQLKEEHRALQSTAGSLRKELEEEQALRNQKQAQFDAFRLKHSGCETLQGQVDAANAQVEELSARCKAMEEEAQTARTKQEEKEAKLRESTAIIGSLQEQLSTLKHQMGSLPEGISIDDLRKNLEAQTRSVNRLKREVEFGKKLQEDLKKEFVALLEEKNEALLRVEILELKRKKGQLS